MKKTELIVHETEELFLQYHSGNLKAREEIIVKNMPLVIYLISNNFTSQMVYDDMDDFLSIGYIGLIKAVDTFDFQKNCSFSTYAARVIFNEIFMYFKKVKKWNTHLSLQQKIPLKDIDGDITFEEAISDNNDFVEDILTQLEYDELHNLLSHLTLREQEVLKYYYGISVPRLMQKEIAEMYQLSQSFISRIVNKSVRKLQKIYQTNMKRKKSQEI